MNNLFTKIYKKSAVMADGPTLIGVIAGIRFYEHPRFGDDYPLIAIKNEKCGLTDYWELPTVQNLIDDNVL